MAKVTYLFGAGASANCLPIVTEIPQRLESFLHFLQSNIYPSSEMFSRQIGYGEITLGQIATTFFEDCNLIIEEVKKHQSIDTYAKKLRITAGKNKANNTNYSKLKAILSCFFIYEQVIKEIDQRYDAFFASILEDSDRTFARNLRILSWNYDFQFEKAYSAYSLEPYLSNNQSSLNVYPSTLRLEDYEDAFSIFKLNGTTGFYHSNDRSNYHTYNELENSDTNKLVFALMQLYAGVLTNDRNIKLLLSFAWERTWTESTKQLIDTAIKSILGTEVLVIIGYSIPFFNRSVDRDLMQAISKTTHSIYIQDKFPANVLESLASIWSGKLPNNIHLKDNVNQFFLPPEL
jgi:hypothetical protein